MSALPDNALVLVTGASGYLASQVIDVLLSLNKTRGTQYRVRGTVREPKPWLNDFFDAKYGPGIFETAIVPDARTNGAFDAALDGVLGVVHVASDTTMAADPHGIIDGTREATTGILAAAAARGIQRFVLTSSSTAAVIATTENPGPRIDTDTWNDAIVAAAWDDALPAAARGYAVYAASKTVGERAAWQWCREHAPPFVFNAVLPSCLFGRILVPGHQGSTMLFVRNLWKGDTAAMHFLAPIYFVDVVDTARLHVAALLDPAVRDERIFAFAHSMNWTDILSTLRMLRPHRTFPDAPPNEGRDHTDVVARPRAEAILKSFWGQAAWTSLEQSLADGIEDLD